MKNITISILLLLSNIIFSQNNLSVSLAQNYLFENKIDSLKFVLKSIASSKEKTILEKISTNKAQYADYICFLEVYNFTDKSSLLKMNKFINSKVKEPIFAEKINLDYVKVKWFQIYQLLNDDNLNLAFNESKKLNTYVGKYKNKDNLINYKKAIIYTRLYPMVVKSIERDIKTGKNLCLNSLKEAQLLNDDFLISFAKTYLKEFLIHEEDLDGFIKTCEEIFSIEEKHKVKSVFYESNIQHYLDGVMFKGNFDPIVVENLLDELYSIQRTKYKSYILYAQYVQYNVDNKLSSNRIFEKFKVNNLKELCDFFINDSKNNLNSNDLIYLYNECASILSNSGNFKDAYRLKSSETFLTKEIYSKELSQSLADFDIQEKNFENAKLVQINKEKEAKLSKQRLIIFGISAALLLFTVLSYFLHKTIKQRNKVYAKLEIANNDLNRLNSLNQKIFSVISHDFKTPLVTLSMLLSILKKKNTDTSLNPYVDEVNTQFESANEILNNLLNWAKSEQTLNNDSLDAKSNVNKKAMEICNQLKHLAESKSITIQKNIPDTIEVNIPADILRIVFRNLLSNAIKFSNENSKIEIHFDIKSNALSIKDYGIGIDTQKLNELFKKEVVSTFGTNREPGFGIGLYIVSELLYKYKCKIKVESELNKGTQFTIQFP